MSSRWSFVVATASCALVLVVGCTSPASPAPSGDVAVDEGATLVVNPVGNDGNGLVTASFTDHQQGRTAYLQTQADGGWNTLATSTLDSSGAASFEAPSGQYTYRAVAAATGASAAAATAVQPRDGQYHALLADDFTGADFDSRYWGARQDGVYGPSRKCSAPSASMSKVADGRATLTVDASDEAQAAKAKAEAIRLGADASDPCPYGTFDNAMVATEGKVQFRYGLVAVRLKFPPEQGVHGSAWLQSTDISDEIDFIESFGLGKGIQYKLHSRQSDGTVVSTGGYIMSIPEVKKASWWDEYHVAAVEWTAKEYVFSVDGQEVYRTSDGVSQTDKYLILSLLTSDWELPRLDAGKLPTTMDVDWVRIWQK